MMRPARLVLIAAVVASTTAVSGVAEAQRKGQGLAQVPLRVLVQTTDSTGAAMQTLGDGARLVFDADNAPVGSEYVHGEEGVVAQINEFGGLTIDFQSTAQSPRRVYFVYSGAPDASAASYSGLRTQLTSANTALQSMATGATQCIPMGTAFSFADGSGYRHSYRSANIASIDTSATAYGQVTRLDVDTWLLESGSVTGGCNGSDTAHVAKLVMNSASKGKTTYTDLGTRIVGFSLLLTRK
jgi:hypothetical protein